MHEFDLIRQYFYPLSPSHFPVGNGDDCAIFPLLNQHLAVSTDAMVEGIHFFPDTDPFALGHKLLAVNLSDLAAMGARPIGCTLTLSIPCVEPPWLESFAQGLSGLAQQYGCPVVGGDTVRHPAIKHLSVTIFGEVPADKALRRNAAQVGDDIWVSGSLGAADIALKILQKPREFSEPHDLILLEQLRPFLERPIPRVALGMDLIGIAHAAIDISDGLLQDLQHILNASGVGAAIDVSSLPVASEIHCLPLQQQLHSALVGGDVYELCFTASVQQRSALEQMSKKRLLTRIGSITEKSGISYVGTLTSEMTAALESLQQVGYQHF